VTDPHWYKDAIIYQLHVKAFYDANEDGIGDFAGLRARLDYLQDLGVDTLWLLPFYPSPQRDDGYDISDYRNVHPAYGTLADFRLFVREAHRRGLRVVTELVINHTSDQHPWFQRARRARKGSAAHSMYVWSDTDKALADTRIIFSDTETGVERRGASVADRQSRCRLRLSSAAACRATGFARDRRGPFRRIVPVFRGCRV
jgi:maltose alpha-D-glucosyltransferase/alpha-amylase